MQEGEQGFLSVRPISRKNEPDETPIEHPALMHRPSDNTRFGRVVVTDGCILEVFAASGPHVEPHAYGLYLIINEKATPIEERGFHLTEDAEGLVGLPVARDLLYKSNA